MESNPSWIEHNFIGQLHVIMGGREFPLHRDLANTRRITAGGTGSNPMFNFKFLSKTSDRLHFNIFDSGPDPLKLGVHDQILSLLTEYHAPDYMKVEPVEWQGNQLRCKLRDHLGHQVKVEGALQVLETGKAVKLTVGEGSPVDFILKRFNPPI